jgi:phytoene synthase
MDELRDTLPAMQRLALAYAPGRTRAAWLALLALDTRLANVLRSSSEPMLAQIRLAWWRDMLARDTADRPGGEPLLALIEAWGDEAAGLVELVDGWEQLAEPEQLGADAMRAFCQGRGAACAALARVAGCPQAQDAARRTGEGWALADLAARLTDPGERETATRFMTQHDWTRIALPRALRPLAILHGIAASAARRSGKLSEPGPGSVLLAVRIGLFGR